MIMVIGCIGGSVVGVNVGMRRPLFSKVFFLWGLFFGGVNVGMRRPLFSKSPLYSDFCLVDILDFWY